jgi:16S rRNA processing protein RimM
MAQPSGSGPGQPTDAPATEDWVHLARIRHPQGRKGELFADILTDFPEKFAERKQLWLLAEPSAAKPSPEGGGGFNPRIKPENAARALAPEGNGSGHSFSSAANASRTVKGTGSNLKGTGSNLKGTGFSPHINPAKTAGALAPEASAAPREVELLNHWPHKGGIVLHFAGVDSISAAETFKGLIVAIPRAQRAALADDELYIGDLIGCALIDVAPAAPVTVGEIESVDRASGPVALLVVRGAAGEVLIPFAKSYLRSIDLRARRVEMALPEGLVDLNAPGKML